MFVLRKTKNSRLGFTLIELMIVVAIIAILAFVAAPKFTDLISRSKESSIKAQLGTLRSAMNIYYSDVQEYPSDLSDGLTTGEKYLKEIPPVTIPSVASTNNPGHQKSNDISTSFDDVASGAWLFLREADQSAFVFINCSHVDSKQNVWSSY